MITNNIEILDFIFHIVHHGEEHPVLMDETPIKEHEQFFKNRISECLEGNQFDFNEDSRLLDKIQVINEDPSLFISVSKEIAVQFHGEKDGRIKAGVLIVIKARIDGELTYILIKYDHENVLTYITNGKSAILKEIENTFSKSKSALQKSAIIDIISEEKPKVIVVDKTDRKNITKFFKEFLGVKRRYSRKDLTKKVKTAFLMTVKQYKNDLPKEFTSSASDIYYDLIQKLDVFEEGDFLKKAMTHHYDDKMSITFKKQLKKQDILGETFLVDKNIPKPKKRKYTTAEGVKIQYGESAKDTVDISNKTDKTIVTITTSRLTEESASD